MPSAANIDTRFKSMLAQDLAMSPEDMARFAPMSPSQKWQLLYRHALFPYTLERFLVDQYLEHIPDSGHISVSGDNISESMIMTTPTKMKTPDHQLRISDISSEGSMMDQMGDLSQPMSSARTDISQSNPTGSSSMASTFQKAVTQALIPKSQRPVTAKPGKTPQAWVEKLHSRMNNQKSLLRCLESFRLSLYEESAVERPAWVQRFVDCGGIGCFELVLRKTHTKRYPIEGLC